jgi:hypothetical protein
VLLAGTGHWQLSNPAGKRVAEELARMKPRMDGEAHARAQATLTHLMSLNHELGKGR